MNKCKGCEWYGKPYWSIMNPCDNCPRENTNVETITRWQDPTIEEYRKEIERLQERNEINIDRNIEAYKIVEQLEKRIEKAIEYIENNDDEWFSAVELIGILQGSDKYEKTME